MNIFFIIRVVFSLISSFVLISFLVILLSDLKNK